MLNSRNFSWLIQKQIISKLLVEKNHAPLLVEKISTNWHKCQEQFQGLYVSLSRSLFSRSLCATCLNKTSRLPFPKENRPNEFDDPELLWGLWLLSVQSVFLPLVFLVWRPFPLQMLSRCVYTYISLTVYWMIWESKTMITKHFFRIYQTK